MAEQKSKQWYKHWWAIILFIFIGFYIFSSYFGDKENTSSLNLKDPVVVQAEPYINKIVNEDIKLRSFASSITNECLSGDKECQLNKIYDYVTNNLSYYSDPRSNEFIQSPSETLKVKGGDCEDLTILMNSLLENLGFKTYIVLTDNHAYSLACGIDTDKLWSYIKDNLVEEMSSELGNEGTYDTEIKSGQLFIIKKYKETISLNPNYVWYYGGDGEKFSEPITYMNIKYSIFSDEPLGIYFVPSIKEQEKIANLESFIHYPTCQKESVYKADSSCDSLIENGGVILFNKNSQDNAKVDLDLSFYYAYDTGNVLSDKEITYYTLGEEKCIVLESTAGKFGFPGYDSTEGKKYAIDPITKEYYFLN